MGGAACEWALGRIGASLGSRKHGRRPVPDRDHRSMRSDPFLDFHQTAERGGYPALLIVSMFALALVVGAVVLLAMTGAVWALLIAVLSIFVALAVVAGGLEAAFADGDEPARARTASGTSAERELAARLPRREAAARADVDDRRAA